MTMMNAGGALQQVGSLVATLIFVRAIFNQCIPYQWELAIFSFVSRYGEKLVRFFSPYLNVTIEEYGNEFDKSEIYTRIETYLSESTSKKARGFKAKFVKDGKALVLGLADYEEVTDEYEGVKVWWSSGKYISGSQTITFYPGGNDKRFYKLTFHGRHRKLITESYLKHIIAEGKAIGIRKRQRKLFTNIKQKGYYCRLWSHVEFHHPATFDTLAMEPTKKQAIINDLLRFSKARDYYTKIGKAWKRGYLLYGPPGTGKSTMIVAMANLLEYDIYDLELTAVKDNTELRRLLIETSGKSIIVIEDIDCSLDLTGQRSSTTTKKDDGEKKEEDHIKKKVEQKVEQTVENKKNEVTLSGLLNFIDGIWSACGEERVIIFTTNHMDKLDPALIRRGRMDFHIELSYCCYEAFKVLAWNYLDVDSHPSFQTIGRLLEQTKMTPADVAENLMPKTLNLNVEECLQTLIITLEKAKEAELKAKEKLKEQQKTDVEVIITQEKAKEAELKAKEKLKEQQKTDVEGRQDDKKQSSEEN